MELGGRTESASEMGTYEQRISSERPGKRVTRGTKEDILKTALWGVS